MPSLVIVVAALMGACGVGLAAAAAHGGGSANLTTAAFLLLVHAAAILAAVTLAALRLLQRPLALAAMTAFAVGGALFAGAMAMRAFAGQRLFPMAAPTGGTLLLAGWLVLAVAAVLAGMARKHR